MQGRPFTAKSVTVAAPPRMVQAAGDPSRRGRRAARTPRKRPGGCLAYGLFICGHVGVSASGRHSFAAALWTIYKGTSIGVLMVLAHLIEPGEYQELHEIIKRQGREDSGAAALNGVGGVAAWRRSRAIVTAVRFVLQSAPREAYRAVCPKKTRFRWKARSSRPCPTRLSG